MEKKVFIGMPLGYAKSILEQENIPYQVVRTRAISRFFTCDETADYVVRVTEDPGKICLLVNYNLIMSNSVLQALANEE
ncbi:hypothetical protein C3L56_03310 [Veillonellaceae bacterium M2-4]|nr:hypothetical protein [Veillonellaceae bacterium M2-4]